MNVFSNDLKVVIPTRSKSSSACADFNVFPTMRMAYMGFGLGVGLELSDSRGLVKSQDTFDVGRCQTVRSREEGVPRIGV